MHIPIKIISGGQTGIDRAALDCAMDHGLETGGWCPEGRLAEDGRIPGKYALQSCDSTKYPVRTRLNVKDSDATLILFCRKMDRGTALTRKLAVEFNKPIMVIDLSAENDIHQIMDWIQYHRIKILNIAGPRESFSPGIHDQGYAFLKQIF